MSGNEGGYLSSPASGAGATPPTSPIAQPSPLGFSPATSLSSNESGSPSCSKRKRKRSDTQVKMFMILSIIIESKF